MGPPTQAHTHLDRGNTEPSAPQLSQENSHRQNTMSSAKDAVTDWDADFTYDYKTLRVGGLVFAGVVVLLSFVLLLGNKVRNCGKTKRKPVAEEDY
ncbi:sodium/potassium-transporting ATPase subunit gamma-like [Xiphophorus maculatus]|uniref:FXYD domain-containing ion transport regulator n=1 Tax=Xiphophorus maculatus TaxID=8083 RepID=A0A3B5R8I0_XIPMA|nr:sodium/potassium-transporting ATPase subunit gamma-like [Xiphophorus maculatus]